MTDATAPTPAQTYRRLLGYAKPYRAWWNGIAGEWKY